MSVSLTFSETLSGAALADSLAGGGVGLSLGSVVNNSFAPVTDKAANTGHQDLFIRHNAAFDPITNVKFYLGIYGGVTGYTYGGNRTAADDYTAIKALGQASGSSKNNADGLSGGVWMDMRANPSTSNQFDQASFPTKVKIFGDNGADGVDLASAFLLQSDAMVWDNTGAETTATTPVNGQIGKSGDQVLGDHAHVRLRIYLPNSQTEGGIYQAELVTAYSYTA